ncbi:MAG TPA: rhodanese-related sulfurtransferase [Cyclobacteriaceae bacterium]|nr:rhodanese-related sulfurtransferase [Cyclobacteriaceae bacterium]
MKHLHNKVDKRVLKQQLHAADRQEKITLSFYKYHQLTDPVAFRNDLFIKWSELGVLGRAYVAHEGINAQISVPTSQFENFKKSLGEINFLQSVRLNIAIEDNGKSFFVLKIQVKKKIVADGLRDESFDVTNSGKHLNAKEFNTLTNAQDTIIVDMRNHYESEVGHFKNAICPDVDTFKASLPVVEQMLSAQKDKNIVMYCTGGIRCEKASAWMKHRGFKHVFQLDGGIIEYARQVKASGIENKFQGKNFVFDERLGERISDTIISVCHQCGKPCDTHTNCRNEACHLLFIQCDDCAKKFDGCCSVECKEVIALPATAQKELRKGKAQGRMVYKKGRSENIKFKV